MGMGTMLIKKFCCTVPTIMYSLGKVQKVHYCNLHNDLNVSLSAKKKVCYSYTILKLSSKTAFGRIA